MDSVFRVELYRDAPEGLRCIDTTLPLTDYGLLDVQERLGLAPGEMPYLEVTEVNECFSYLEKWMQESPDLYKLNALARRLDALDAHGLGAFEGMVGMHIQKEETPLTVAALIDMAYNTDQCHVVPEVSTDCELGRFYAENGFVEEAEGLDDAAFELLDFGRIGQEFRQSEGGVFTSLGYVVQSSPPEPMADKLDYAPKKPDYVFRVGFRKNHDNAFLGEKSVSLPTSEVIIQTIPGILGVDSLNDAWISSFDGPIPELENAVRSPVDLPALNELAKQVRVLDEAGKLPCFKAVLAARGCDSVDAILAESKSLDEYLLTPSIRFPEDLAREELRLLLNAEDVEPLLKHVDLRSYGRELLSKENTVLTDYGLLDRTDGQPIQTIDKEPTQGGMEMMM